MKRIILALGVFLFLDSPVSAQQMRPILVPEIQSEACGHAAASIVQTASRVVRELSKTARTPIVAQLDYQWDKYAPECEPANQSNAFKGGEGHTDVCTDKEKGMRWLNWTLGVQGASHYDRMDDVVRIARFRYEYRLACPTREVPDYPRILKPGEQPEGGR